MTDPQVGMLMLGLFIFIIMLGFPIAFTLMAMGVGFGYYAYFTPGQDFFQNRIFTLLVHTPISHRVRISSRTGSLRCWCRRPSRSRRATC
jgi:TRAP-type mannitol/chloroaromatic compound transport system permease large subunit